jgi:hypothetical protein
LVVKKRMNTIKQPGIGDNVIKSVFNINLQHGSIKV